MPVLSLVLLNILAASVKNLLILLVETRNPPQRTCCEIYKTTCDFKEIVPKPACDMYSYTEENPLFSIT
jgi:hypothetical protein